MPYAIPEAFHHTKKIIIAQQIQYHKATKPHNNKFINLFSQLPTFHKWWKCIQWEVVGFDFIPCMWFQTLAKRNGSVNSDSTLTAYFQQYGSWWPLRLFPVVLEIYKNLGSLKMNWQVFAALLFFLTLFYSTLGFKSARTWQMPIGKFHRDLHIV